MPVAGPSYFLELPMLRPVPECLADRGLPEASSPAEETSSVFTPCPTPRDLAETCGEWTIAQLCEQAHRDVTGKPLALADWNPRVLTKKIRGHLKECPLCARWYRNARRAYERLLHDVSAVLPDPRLTHPSVPRTGIRRGAACSESVGIQLHPIPGEGLLDGRTVLIDWRKPEGTPQWTVSLSLMPYHEGHPETVGNTPEAMQILVGSTLLVECQFPGRSEADHIVTRLDLTAEGHLATFTGRTLMASVTAEDLLKGSYTMSILELNCRPSCD